MQNDNNDLTSTHASLKMIVQTYIYVIKADGAFKSIKNKKIVTTCTCIHLILIYM